MRKSELLKYAIEHTFERPDKLNLFDSPSLRSSYICIAVDTAGFMLDETELAQDIQCWIRGMLQGHSTVTGWLKAQGCSPYSHPRVEHQAYRLRWAEHLIAYLESIGE